MRYFSLQYMIASICTFMCSVLDYSRKCFYSLMNSRHNYGNLAYYSFSKSAHGVIDYFVHSGNKRGETECMQSDSLGQRGAV